MYERKKIENNINNNNRKKREKNTISRKKKMPADKQTKGQKEILCLYRFRLENRR
jgi:hypothetical protein